MQVVFGRVSKEGFLAKLDMSGNLTLAMHVLLARPLFWIASGKAAWIPVFICILRNRIRFSC